MRASVRAGSPCPRWPVGFEQTTTTDSAEGTRKNKARYLVPYARSGLQSILPADRPPRATAIGGNRGPGRSTNENPTRFVEPRRRCLWVGRSGCALPRAAIKRAVGHSPNMDVLAITRLGGPKRAPTRRWSHSPPALEDRLIALHWTPGLRGRAGSPAA